MRFDATSLTVPKVCPKISNTIERHQNPSKPGRPGKSEVYRGNPLFSALSLRVWPPTHGRSHRFKSSIAHSLDSPNLVLIKLHRLQQSYEPGIFLNFRNKYFGIDTNEWHQAVTLFASLVKIFKSSIEIPQGSP